MSNIKQHLIKRAKARRALRLKLERRRQTQPGGLVHFVRYFWSVIEPETDFVNGWAFDAICEHLEAVSDGRIKRLLINVPPGFSKSLLTNVFFPAWEWAARGMPHMRYISFSYASNLTERDNRRLLALVTSREFQEIWGDKFDLDKAGEVMISNSKTGWKLATSVGGVGTGLRGNRVICDDPHDVMGGDSELKRTHTVQWFRHAASNRLNSLREDAIIVIMQRVNENDVSGAILSAELGYCHLRIPMEYDLFDIRNGAKVATQIGWTDPRWKEGELAWPQRYDFPELNEFKREPYLWAGQYQQSPAPKGGGIIKREWWMLYDDAAARDLGQPSAKNSPVLEYIFASLDPAFTKDEQNDPSGFTVWGLFRDRGGNPKLILLDGWSKRLELHGPDVHQMNDELKADYIARAKQTWGLIEWVAYSCERFKVHALLIESKASGISVAQEIRRLHAGKGWDVRLIDPKGMDKVARVHSIVGMFTDEMIYAPDKDWADLVIGECTTFPKGAHDDLVDSTSMALKHVREVGLALRKSEVQSEVRDNARHRPLLEPLYPA